MHELDQKYHQLFEQVAGYQMSMLHVYLSVICGGFIVICTAVIIINAVWQFYSEPETTHFTFMLVLMFALMFMSIFLLFVVI